MKIYKQHWQFIDNTGEVKTHRAACAIDDFFDDSKQALSMMFEELILVEVQGPRLSFNDEFQSMTLRNKTE